MTNAEYPLDVILTITTGKVLCHDFCDARRLVEYMSGWGSMWTIQMLQVAMRCKDEILLQYPELADVDASGVTVDNWDEFLKEQRARFGDTLSISPWPRNEAQP